MGAISEEVKIWKTPVVGAFLLWSFTKGYSENHPSGEAPIGILHFFASAILTNPALSETISDRRDDLQSYVRGFEDKKSFDQLMSIQNKIASSKDFTLSSIDIAVSQGLLFWDVDSATIHCKLPLGKPARGNNLRPSMKSLGRKAEILGKWFSQHDLVSISRYLKVVL